MPLGEKPPTKPGERISINVTPWLVEGILREGVNNLSRAEGIAQNGQKRA